jgi:predicted transcriptional regulator YdeE
MQKIKISLPALHLVGLSCRTSLQHEVTPSSAKIPVMLQQYFGNQSSEKIPHRLAPHTTYCVYTDYESDYTGEYTYFVGEKVSSFEDVPEGFSSLTIPAQHYVKMTVGPGKMPQICIESWQEQVWALSPEELRGERAYLADFEVYDERAADPKNTILDIYVGIKQ